MQQLNQHDPENTSATTPRKTLYSALGWFCVCVFLVLVFFANRMTPFTTDDFWYQTNLVTTQPIQNINDIVQSQIWHFFHWGGRTIAHTLLQFTLWGGPLLSDIVNVTVYFLLALVMCRYSGSISSDKLLFSLSLPIAINPNWFDTTLWQSGTANYLYMSFFVLLYIEIFLLYLREQQTKIPNTVLSIIMIPLGLFAGWSNENMGPAAVVTSLLVIVMCIVEKKKTSSWMWIGTFFSGIGTCLVVFAPGNFARADVIAGIESQSFLERILRTIWSRYISISEASFNYLWKAIVVLIFLLIIRKVLQIKTSREDIILLIAAILSFIIMWFSPHYPERACFGTIVLIGCFSCRVWDDMKKSSISSKAIRNILLTFFVMSSMSMLITYIVQMTEFSFK